MKAKPYIRRLSSLLSLVGFITGSDCLSAADNGNAEIESLVKRLTSDENTAFTESRIRDGGYGPEDIWQLVERAKEEKDPTLLSGTYYALEITGFDSAPLLRQLKKEFKFERDRIRTLRTWTDIMAAGEDPDDIEDRMRAYFAVEYRQWVVVTAFRFLGKELNEAEDIHPFLLPKFHAIMLSGLKWIETHGTDESVPVLEAILSKEPKNAGPGGIAEYAKSALDAVVKRDPEK